MSNSGPDNMFHLKTVSGSFHQGHPRFGSTSGVQCTMNCLVSICWSSIKRACYWKSSDLDYILEQGNMIFSDLGFTSPIEVDDIPSEISISSELINVTLLDRSHGLLGNDHLFSCHTHTQLDDSWDGAIFTTAGYSFSLIFDKSFIYLFDPHSRDYAGNFVPDGFSVLLKFRSLSSLQCYVKSIYSLHINNFETTQYDIQYVRIVIDDQVKLNVKKSIRKKTESARKRKKPSQKDIAGTSQHFKKLKLRHEKLASTRIDRFLKEICEGPLHVCVICHRSMYKRSVKFFEPSNYHENCMEFVSYVTSFDGICYICLTCNKKLLKTLMPCQAVTNCLDIYDLPKELNLNRLEKVLISRRILFKKIAIMPKGQSPKLKGSICNVPIQSGQIVDTLPNGSDSCGIVMVKLKRKLAFRGHVFFEPVRPDKVFEALVYLQANNVLYSDIHICMDNIPVSLSSFEEVSEEPNTEELQLEEPDDAIESVNLNHNMLHSEETMLLDVSETPDVENIDLAPGENISPLSILTDDFCEELSHPYLFPTGKFGYRHKRPVKLTPSKYFNQRLLNYTQRFSSDSDYIFFALSSMQLINLNSCINIAMKKVAGAQLTAGNLSSDFENKMQTFIAEDKSFRFMAPMKGTPAYWKRFLQEVLAMVKQLGLPTFFMTLSCADLRWNELIKIISSLNGQPITDDQINELSYFERCQYLNLNPVLLARHFQYRVEVFFKEIVVNGQLGKVSYQAVRVEFQLRGSPHIHSFLWILNAPSLSCDNINAYIEFVDSSTKAYVPNIEENPKLHALVTTYQIHSHSKSCRKYKNQVCRYHFGRFFTDKTIVAVPLSENIDEEEKNQILASRDSVLSKVKCYIDQNLNPKSKNFLFPNKDDYVLLPSIKEILNELELTESEYYHALRISIDADFQIHLKRPPNSCFVNNYFDEGLLAWQANLDIQPVINYFKAVAYMCAYFSKCENETSEAMKQAAREAATSGCSYREQMKMIARAFTTKRQCSVQEAVYILMPELWLRKTFPVVVFANSNLPDKRYRMCRSKEEVVDLPEDSTDIFKRNVLDRYIDRPDKLFLSGKYAVLDEFCFAMFHSYYYITSSKIVSENDCQPTVLLDDCFEQHVADGNYPKIIPLMNSKEKLKCRKVKAVLRYYAPSSKKNPEGYAHHILFMFYPFRDEKNLLSSNGTYTQKLHEPDVMDTILRNKQIFEPHCELVEQALSTLHSELPHNCDPSAANENDEVEDMLTTQNHSDEPDDQEETNLAAPSTCSTISFMADDQLNNLVMSLNFKQREIYTYILDWGRKRVKNHSTEIDPIHIFLSGAGGCGKSHLLNTLYQALSKLFSYRSADINKTKVLRMAPTGIAAININGTTIHTALGIPVGCFKKNLPKLSDQRRSTLRNQLNELKVIIIDEISMVSNYMLLHINLRLIEIFGNKECKPFANVSVIACGDLFQLPPINQPPVYSDFTEEWLNIDHIWKHFKLAELTEVMRQQGHDIFINLLNNVRTGQLTSADVNLLRSRIINIDPSADTLHIFAENAPAKLYNDSKLELLEGRCHFIPAMDEIPENVPKSVIDRTLKQNQSRTGGLAQILKIKVGARVMLTTNIDIEDRLINGQIGAVIRIKINNNSDVEKIYVKFDDNLAGLKKQNDTFTRENCCVPILRSEAQIRLQSKNNSSPSIKRTQFPLMLCWACTVHKVQGLTLEKVVVSLELKNQRSFNYGQLYVAFSRAKSIHGLMLIGEFDPKFVKSDPRAMGEYLRLRACSSLPTPVCCSVVSNISLCVSLLNTRSFRKHCFDIVGDFRLTNSDILCLTETQILPDTVLPQCPITDKFNFHHNINSTDRFQSLAFGVTSDVQCSNHIKIQGISLFTLKKQSFSSQSFTILLLYRKPTSNLNAFICLLSQLIETHDVDIVLGDFNVDAAKQNMRLCRILQQYNQLVQEPTHLDGSILDHIYVKTQITNSFTINTFVYGVQFSDHDCVHFRLTKN